jgi:hypothetical protein
MGGTVVGPLWVGRVPVKLCVVKIIGAPQPPLCPTRCRESRHRLTTVWRAEPVRLDSGTHAARPYNHPLDVFGTPRNQGTLRHSPARTAPGGEVRLLACAGRLESE